MGLENTERPKEQINIPIISLPIDNILAVYFQTICSSLLDIAKQLFSKVITICLSTSNIKLEFCCYCVLPLHVLLCSFYLITS